MSRINILILCFVVTLAFLNLTVAVTPVVVDTFEVECNYTTESAQWRKNCNWCRCSETGRGLCTRRGCPPGLETRLGEEKDCTETAQWKQDCNWCTCHDERKICTSKYCGDLPRSVPKIERRVIGKSLSSSPKCESISEGANYKDACNWCRCVNNTALCTKKLCPPAGEEKSATVTSDCNGEVVWRKGCERCECVDGFSVCAPGSCVEDDTKTECTESSEGGRWRKDCNWCTCGNGRGLCTRRGCRPGDLLRDTPVCEGDITWKEECNWCRCIEGKALCTKDICGLNSKDSSKCEDGQAWVDGCNNCFCNNGMPFCTRRACVRALMNEIQPAVLEKRAIEVSAMASGSNNDFGECTDGSRWMRNCNWCSCFNKTAICTARGCLPGYEEKQKPPFCDENSHWKDDCNMCSCANGVPVCTKKGCGPAIIIPQSSGISFTPLMTVRREIPEGVSCTEGSRWRVNCNWCTCSNGAGACTIMACLPGFKDQGPVCEGESEWKARDDSWCKCESGQAVCQPAGPVEVAINPRTGMPVQSIGEVKECTDGSRWRKSCNWCSCTGGRGICTLRGCLPGSKDNGPECDEGSEWRGDNCSWCHCEGGKSVCLPSTCSPQAQPSANISPTMSLFSHVQKREPSCTDGSRWTQLCNWCTCSNGVGLCEQRACLSVDAAREMDKSCERDSRWKLDCNWCNCVNGRGICTSNDCTQSVSNDPVSTNDGGCISGNSWLDKCNICVCTNNTTSCTKKACLPEQRSSVQCTDGDVWRDDCNSCQCINGEAACTKKLCPTLRNSQEVASLCFLPAVNPEVKLCGGFETRWTYNSIKLKCEDVIYGGCGATENLFDNEQECQITCGTQEQDMKLANLSKNPKETCSMPVVPGPCFARHVRYAFFSERNRCEKFYYGGCQGNENNFESVDECYNMCGGNPPALDPECDRSKCDWKRYGHYLAQDCEPIYEGEICCPTRFACKSEEERGRVPDKCYYKGKEYQLNEEVPVEDECSASCKCLQRSNDNIAEITCANVECPSLFRRPNPGCRLLFTPGQCCETDRECVDTQDAPPQLDQRSSNCNWKNESWKLGDKMFFQDDPCKSCICTADFTDPSGPGCKQLSCGFDFKYRSNYIQGCIPLYFEERCCSIDWICPGDRRLENAMVQPNINNQEVDSTNMCTLGDLTVPAGESVKLSDCQIKCDCKAPPGLTCVKYRSCDIAEEIKPQRRLQLRTTIGSEIPTKTYTCEKSDCPPSCLNPSVAFDESTGCNVCKCECRKDFRGKPPCPLDCAVKIIFDAETGCDKCICDSSVSVNPFNRP